MNLRPLKTLVLRKGICSDETSCLNVIMVWNKLLKEVKLLILALFEVHTEKMLGSLNKCVWSLDLTLWQFRNFTRQFVPSKWSRASKGAITKGLKMWWSPAILQYVPWKWQLRLLLPIFVPIAIPCVWDDEFSLRINCVRVLRVFLTDNVLSNIDIQLGFPPSGVTLRNKQAGCLMESDHVIGFPRRSIKCG